MSAESTGHAFARVALVAALVFGLAQARAAGHVATTVLEVRAAVVPSVVLSLENSAAQVSISEADIARGYIDLPESSLLSVNAGFLNPVLVVDFSPSGSPFKSVEMVTVDLRSLVRRTQVLEDSPIVLAGELKAIPSLADATRLVAALESGSATLISYRFRLADDVQPGTYPIPMTVNVGL
jgi:hypothetical protein